MADVLLAVAILLLVIAAIGLLAILRRPGNVDRTMAPQLIGTSGVAILLLLADATATSSLVDVALTLALLAAFAAVAFVRCAPA